MSRRGSCDQTERGLQGVEFGSCLRVWVCGDFGKHEEGKPQDSNMRIGGKEVHEGEVS